MISLSEKIKNLPTTQGIYKYFDKNDDIIYVGKAKNLKNRVSSYFNNKQALNKKTKYLVEQIVRIEYTVVQNETDALLLENNLIKQLQPKYNILLKDGKSYPYLCIIDEEYPRIVSTRNKTEKGEYFGPYASIQTVNTLLELFHKIYPLRTCKLDLNDKNIKEKKYKSCLEFQIGNCNAPCIEKETIENYNKYIDDCKNILKGKLQDTKNYLKQEMYFFSHNYEYEKAELIKKKLQSLENYQSKSTIVSQTIENIKVITVKKIDSIAVINHLELTKGTITFTKTIEVKFKLDENEEEILEKYILSINPSLKKETIITNIEIKSLEHILQIEYPKIGEKFQLIQLSIKNCFAYLNEKIKQNEATNKKRSGLTILEQAKKDLHLKEIPFHIECFDNSNIQGTTPVASMVCFKNSLPSKKDYRHYNIKTVVGPDDFASMEEIVLRRYDRLIKEKLPIPQLILIDGGKGQLKSAMKSIEKLNLKGKVTVISIAKRLEEIYYPGDQFPLYLEKNSTTLKLLQRLRDEAHRFAITFHRLKRNKNTLSLEIENIKGIGSKTIDLLLKKYKSTKNISEIPKLELEELIGSKKSMLILNEIKKGM